MERPLLLVDIDGVLNPWAIDECPAGFSEYWLFPEDEEPVRLAAAHGEWLMELAKHFDVVWASAWGSQAHRLLGPILGLEEFPFVPMPDTPFQPRDKVPAVAMFVGDRPAAWVDDQMVPEAHAWARSRGEPTLLLEVDHRVGLGRGDVERLLAWVRDL